MLQEYVSLKGVPCFPSGPVMGFFQMSGLPQKKNK